MTQPDTAAPTDIDLGAAESRDAKPDLMFQDEIRDLVRGVYDDLEEPDGPATVFYDDQDIAWLPDRARRWALGVGAPVAHAKLQPGEDVVDLGCGAGIDALLAGREVAPDGWVLGVDMLERMVTRASGLAEEAGLHNVDFRAAPMEELPLDDASVDVVISNGAINLTARKSRVIAEAFRVLRPGGRMVVADLTIKEEELPTQIITHPSAWAG
ncbi:MAG: methyltransferase domain-containing protein [Nitriliruptorales bacterium]|nr:methyltransferase domain-containing protein [Nitriliruptorales bacterium]